MAREHGRLLTSIWRDPDFRARTAEAQRMYAVLISQGIVNNAGVLPLQISKWAKASDHTTEQDVYDALIELFDSRFVYFDEDTEETLIRSFIRNDGVLKQPNIFKNALRCAGSVESPFLRAALAVELRRLKRDDASSVASDLDPNETAEEVISKALETLPEPFENPSETLKPFRKGFETLRGRGRGRGKVSVGSNSSSKNSSSSAMPPREDVDSLCSHLLDKITGNGGKATITEKWRNEARLLLDADKVELDVAHRLIDWCQDDPFWHTNILSMTKFRQQYQQLLLKARAQQRERPPGRTATGLTPREMEIARAELLKENPNQALLEHAGLGQANHLRAIEGGAM